MLSLIKLQHVAVKRRRKVSRWPPGLFVVQLTKGR